MPLSHCALTWVQPVTHLLLHLVVPGIDVCPRVQEKLADVQALLSNGQMKGSFTL